MIKSLDSATTRTMEDGRNSVFAGNQGSNNVSETDSSPPFHVPGTFRCRTG